MPFKIFNFWADLERFTDWVESVGEFLWEGLVCSTLPAIYEDQIY
jgi:hypothetical protein